MDKNEYSWWSSRLNAGPISQDTIDKYSICTSHKDFLWSVWPYREWMTWVFWFAPNNGLHVGHLHCIAGLLKLKTNQIIFSSNDLEARLMRQSTNFTQAYKDVEELRKMISVQSQIIVRTEDKKTSSLARKIIKEAKQSHYDEVFEESGRSLNTKNKSSLAYHAAWYLSPWIDSDAGQVLAVTWIDELLPMIWTNYMAGKYSLPPITFFITNQIPWVLFQSDQLSSEHKQWKSVPNVTIFYNDLVKKIDIIESLLPELAVELREYFLK